MKKIKIKNLIVKVLIFSLLLCNSGMSVLASSIEDVVEMQEENKNNNTTPSKIYKDASFPEIEEEIEESDNEEIYEEDINGDFEEEPEEDVIINDNEEELEKEQNNENEQKEDLFNVEINDKKEELQENINNENIEEIKEEAKTEEKEINDEENKIDTPSETEENFEDIVEEEKEENIKKETPSEVEEIEDLEKIIEEKRKEEIETPSETEKILTEIKNVATPSDLLKINMFGAVGPVCKIGATEFLTLGEAITALKNGSATGEIVFINDLEITDTSEYQEIDINIDVNIDFNNNKLKVTSVMPKIEDSKGIITKKGTGKLYIKNMIIETYFNSSQGDADETNMFYVDNGEVKFEDTKYETIDISLYSGGNAPRHSFVVIKNNSKVISTGDGTSINLIKSWPSYGYCHFNFAFINEGELEIEKGTYKVEYLVYGSGSLRSDSSDVSKVYIKNGTFEVANILIYLTYYVDIQIDDGTFITDSSLICVHNATSTSKAIIKNGTFTINENILSTYPPANPLCLEIKDGKYEYEALIFSMYSYTQPQNMKITGGKFRSTKVDGVTFTVDDAKEEIKKSIAFRGTIESATSPYQWKVLLPAPICEVGTNKYITLQDAVDDIENGIVFGNIKILRDFEISTTSDLLLIDTTSDINIDFNNKKATIKIIMPRIEDGKGIFTKRGSGNLYIKNIILETMWLATQGADDNTNIFYVESGSLKLENIKYDNIDISAYSGTGYSVPRQDFIVIRNNAKVILTGNETNIDMVKDWIMYSTPTYCFFKFVNIDEGTLEIEDGTYEARDFINQEGMTRTGLTKVIIKDGTFNTKSQFVLLTQNFDIEIESGNFTCASGLFLFKNIASTAKTKIKNGVFDVNGSLVETNTVASIKVEIDNGNYKYNTIFGWAATHQNILIKGGNFHNKLVNGTTFTIDDAKEEIQKCIGFRYTVEPATSPYQWKVMPPVPMCKVGTTEFLSLQAAVEAIKAGSVSGDIVVTKDFELSTSSDIQEIDININVNIDFNNKKMKVTTVMPKIEDGKGVITKKGTGTLYIKNMIIETAYNSLQGDLEETNMFYIDSGDAKFENVKYENIDISLFTGTNNPAHTFVVIRNNSKVVLTGNNTNINLIKEVPSYPGRYCNFNILNVGEGNIEIEKGTYKAAYIINNDNSKTASSNVSKIYIKNGTFETENNFLYLRYYVDIQIDNGNYTSKLNLMTIHDSTNTSKAIINNGIFSSTNVISTTPGSPICLEVKNGKYKYNDLLGMAAYSYTQPQNMKIVGGEFFSTKVDGTTFTVDDAKEEIKKSIAFRSTIEPATLPYQWKVMPPAPMCKVGTTEFMTFENAIDAIKAGSVSGDIIVTRDFEISTDSDIQEIDITIDVNIDFNNKKMKITSVMPVINDSKGVITKKGTGKLYIKNMIVETYYNALQNYGYGNDTSIFYSAGGEIKFENVKYETIDTTLCGTNVPIHYFIIIKNNSKVIITGNSTSIDLVKEIPSIPGAYYEIDVAKVGEGSIEIEKGTYKANRIIRPEDTAMRSASSGLSKIYIKDGVFDAKQHFIFANYNVDIQIDNGTISGGGLIKVNYPTPTSKAIIKNGNFISNYLLFDGYAPSDPANPLYLEIENGKFQYLDLSTYYSSSKNLKITGGEYYCTKVDGTTYTIDDAKNELKNNLVNKYVIEPATSPYQWKVLPPPVLCKIGTIDYISLKDAIDDVTANQTIEVVADINIDDVTEFINVPASKNFDFTINFNNKTLTIATQSNANGYFIKNNTGKININNAKINYINNTTLDSVIFSLQNGELAFQNIIYKCLATTVNTGFININGGVLSISGNSTEIDESVGISNYIYKVTNNATINMTAGKYYGGILVSNQSTTPINLNMNNCNVDLLKNTSSVGNFILNDSASHIININNGTYIYNSFLNTNKTTDYPTNTNIKIFSGKFKDTRFDLDNETELTDIITKMNEYVLNADSTGELETKRNGVYIEIKAKYVPPVNPPYRPSGGNGGGGGGRSTIPIYDENGNIIKPSTVYEQPIISETNNVNADKKYDWVKDNNGYWELTISTDGNKRKCIGELVEVEEIVNNQKVVSKYLFTLDGKMFTGWFVGENGITYYFNADKNANMGKMVKGWKEIDNNYYCFNNDGILLVNTITPDGYKVDLMGRWVRN